MMEPDTILSFSELYRRINELQQIVQRQSEDILALALVCNQMHEKLLAMEQKVR